jgi:enamine deaminase RidA (YjgF/YER057c/UK114 family)
MVKCAPGFNRTPDIINGASALLIDIFGIDAGSHARSAIGVAELPFGMAVEIEMIIELEQS